MRLATVLPLALVMVAGPQAISAFFFATSEKWRSDSAAYILGAAASITAVVSASYLLTKGVEAGSSSEGSSSSPAVDDGIAVLLLLAMIFVFRRRDRTDPPKWMGRLQTATPRLTFVLGFLLLGFFPSDVITSIGVGAHLANHGDPWWHALPFVLFTLLLLALPALLVLALGRRARGLLPRARNWMNAHSWIVSEVVLAFFFVIVLTG